MLILDFDLHHGNGTADIFADDSSVLFIDTHEASSIYPPPFAPAGAEDVGRGPGRGTTINVPLPRKRCAAGAGIGAGIGAGTGPVFAHHRVPCYPVHKRHGGGEARQLGGGPRRRQTASPARASTVGTAPDIGDSGCCLAGRFTLAPPSSQATPAARACCTCLTGWWPLPPSASSQTSSWCLPGLTPTGATPSSSCSSGGLRAGRALLGRPRAARPCKGGPVLASRRVGVRQGVRATPVSSRRAAGRQCMACEPLGAGAAGIGGTAHSPRPLVCLPPASQPPSPAAHDRASRFSQSYSPRVVAPPHLNLPHPTHPPTHPPHPFGRSSTYHSLACRLRELAGRLCGGRLLFLLEGGYHTEAVAESVREVSGHGLSPGVGQRRHRPGPPGPPLSPAHAGTTGGRPVGEAAGAAMRPGPCQAQTLHPKPK